MKVNIRKHFYSFFFLFFFLGGGGGVEQGHKFKLILSRRASEVNNSIIIYSTLLAFMLMQVVSL